MSVICALLEQFISLDMLIRCPSGSESAATLEAESGYAMETPEVTDFRQYILEARWSKAEDALHRLGVHDREALWVKVSACSKRTN